MKWIFIRKALDMYFLTQMKVIVSWRAFKPNLSKQSDSDQAKAFVL